MTHSTQPEPTLEWYCLRTKTNSEHIAATHLRQTLEIDAFCPRIRYYRSTARGKVLFHQAMFPCYLFAKFDLRAMLRAVTFSRGVTDIVRFGDSIPPVSEDFIDFLRLEVGPTESKLVETRLEPGSRVEITEGPFRGMKAIVQVYMPAKERVKLLLEVLGRTTTVEAAADSLVTEALSLH